MGSEFWESCKNFSLLLCLSILFKSFCTWRCSVTIGDCWVEVVENFRYSKKKKKKNLQAFTDKTKLGIKGLILYQQKQGWARLCWCKFWAAPLTISLLHECQQLRFSQGILKCWQGRCSLHLPGSVRHFRRLASKAHLPMVFLWIKNCDCSLCNLCFHKAASPQRALKYFASQRPHSDLSYIDINEN